MGLGGTGYAESYTVDFIASYQIFPFKDFLNAGTTYSLSPRYILLLVLLLIAITASNYRRILLTLTMRQTVSEAMHWVVLRTQALEPDYGLRSQPHNLTSTGKAFNLLVHHFLHLLKKKGIIIIIPSL